MTKEEKHLHNLILTSGIVVKKDSQSSNSVVFFDQEGVYEITLGLDLPLKEVLITFYHELGHYNYLLNKTLRKITYFSVIHNRWKFKGYFKNHFILCDFLTYLWEMLAWQHAKKELQKTELWNSEMRKTFFEFRKRCLRYYLGYKFK
jgi:hypothetical protein